MGETVIAGAGAARISTPPSFTVTEVPVGTTLANEASRVDESPAAAPPSISNVIVPPGESDAIGVVPKTVSESLMVVELIKLQLCKFTPVGTFAKHPSTVSAPPALVVCGVSSESSKTMSTPNPVTLAPATQLQSTVTELSPTTASSLLTVKLCAFATDAIIAPTV